MKTKKIVEYISFGGITALLAFVFYYSNYGVNRKHEGAFNRGSYKSTAKLIFNSNDRSKWEFQTKDGATKIVGWASMQASYKSGEKFLIEVANEDPDIVRILYDQPVLEGFEYGKTKTENISKGGHFKAHSFTYRWEDKVYKRSFETNKENLIDSTRDYLVKVNLQYPDVAYVYLDSVIAESP